MSLPIFPDMTDDQVTQVAEAIRKFLAIAPSAGMKP